MKQDKRKEFYYFIPLINNDFARHFEKGRMENPESGIRNPELEPEPELKLRPG